MSSSQILAFFAKYIESELGIVYSESNYFQLQNRLEEISKYCGLKGVEELYDVARVEIGGNLKQLLLDVATNNETSFFRDPKVFAALSGLIEKQLAGELFADQSINIWSAASSTGQEALSIAITIQELMLKHSKTISYSILGTDISKRALEKAKAGQYSQLEVQRGLSTQRLLRHFKRNEKDYWMVSDELSRNVEFKTMNLRDKNYPFSGFHFIFCRNVLIYQSIECKKEILTRLTSKLVPGGFLVLGAGESLLGLSNDYQLTMLDGAAFYRRSY